MQLVNFHCHLASITNIEQFLHKSTDIYVSNALDDVELKHHLSVQKDNFYITTGQHPLYPRDSITEEITLKLVEANKIFAVGEIGLDKRNLDLKWQTDVFLKFCDIANQFHKPVIVHCVGHYYELLALIKKHFPSLLYIMHSFQGSVDIINAYSKLNVVFSLHSNIMKTKNSRNALNAIFDNHSYVFETDQDDNNTHSVLKTIQGLAAFCEKDETELMKRQYEVKTKLLQQE